MRGTGERRRANFTAIAKLPQCHCCKFQSVAWGNRIWYVKCSFFGLAFVVKDETPGKSAPNHKPVILPTPRTCRTGSISTSLLRARMLLSILSLHYHSQFAPVRHAFTTTTKLVLNKPTVSPISLPEHMLTLLAGRALTLSTGPLAYTGTHGQ